MGCDKSKRKVLFGKVLNKNLRKKKLTLMGLTYLKPKPKPNFCCFFSKKKFGRHVRSARKIMQNIRIH